ncbi:MAG: site-2 protease family protein [Actinomycetota bacterium]|nr:site-2 protease family protein [Actinomycetota bacterium]
MFNLPQFRLGRLLGIPIEAHPTWLIAFALFAGLLSFNVFPAVFDWPVGVALLNGVLTALLFFASILVHEMSHCLVARAGGIKISKITLFIFGGLAQMDEEPRSPGRELVMAVAGPGASLLLAALFFAVYAVLAFAGVSDRVWGPLEYLALINLSLAVFNMLPGFPLDGGRVLRAILWAASHDILKATRWASRAGQVIGYLMIGGAVVGVLSGMTQMIWTGLVGWFITFLAEGSYRQQVVKSHLAKVDVGSIMSPNPVVVSGDTTLYALVHERFLGDRHSRYPVVEDGRVVGLVSLPQVKLVPQEEWHRMTAGQAADRDLARLVVDDSTPVDDVLVSLGKDRPGALLVVRDGHVVGIVTRADVVSALQDSAGEGV